MVWYLNTAEGRCCLRLTLGRDATHACRVTHSEIAYCVCTARGISLYSNFTIIYTIYDPIRSIIFLRGGEEPMEVLFGSRAWCLDPG